MVVGRAVPRAPMVAPVVPLLFLDVDGPLIPFGPGHHPTYPPRPQHPGANPLLARIDPAHGPRLAALPCTPVWATTWEHDANAAVCPRLGLPPLPVVIWPDPSPADAARDAREGLHWKTRSLAAWAADRPFAWLDDEATAADAAWLTAHHPAPTLVLSPDPRRGLTPSDYAALTRWLTGTPDPIPPDSTAARSS